MSHHREILCLSGEPFLSPTPSSWRLPSERRNRPIRSPPPFLLPGLQHLSSVTRKFQSRRGRGARWGQARGAWLCRARPLHLAASRLRARCSGTRGWARVTRQNCSNCVHSVHSTVSGLLARPTFFTAALSARKHRGAWATAYRRGRPASYGGKVTSRASSTLWLCPA